MPKKLNVVLIGCGYIARTAHLPLLNGSGKAKVVAVCDQDRATALRVAEEFGVPRAYGNTEEMFNKEDAIDIVDICTPPDSHADIAEQSLEMGHPCIVEKPLATKVEDADRVIGSASQKGLGVYVIHNYSFVPCIRTARRLTKEGRIGKIVIASTRYFTSLKKERYLKKTHWTHSLPSGILTSEITPHLLMLLLDFLTPPSDVRILTMKLSGILHVTADELRMMVTCQDGGQGNLSLSYNSPVPGHTLDLIGEEGVVLTDLFTQTCVCHRIPRGVESTDQITRSAFQRGSWTLNEIMQRSASFTAVASNVLLGRYKMAAEGHRYLFEACFRDLISNSGYPVDLAKCREVVRLMDLLARHLREQPAA